MKVLGKIIGSVLLIAYAIVAISVTVLLLSYNEYHVSEIGGYTFILMGDDNLEPEYNQGDLILVKEADEEDINVGDNIFLYRHLSTSQTDIRYAQVLLKEEGMGEGKSQYVLEGNTIIDYEDVIGTTKDIKVIPNVGTILSILQSRYGYLFLIVVVTFVAFLYELYELIMEIKYGSRIEKGTQEKGTQEK